MRLRSGKGIKGGYVGCGSDKGRVLLTSCLRRWGLKAQSFKGVDGRQGRPMDETSDRIIGDGRTCVSARVVVVVVGVMVMQGREAGRSSVRDGVVIDWAS